MVTAKSAWLSLVCIAGVSGCLGGDEDRSIEWGRRPSAGLFARMASIAEACRFAMSCGACDTEASICDGAQWGLLAASQACAGDADCQAELAACVDAVAAECGTSAPDAAGRDGPMATDVSALDQGAALGVGG